MNAAILSDCVDLSALTANRGQRDADITNQRYQLQLARNGSNADPTLPLVGEHLSSSTCDHN